jgi:hypothetical protein
MFQMPVNALLFTFFAPGRIISKLRSKRSHIPGKPPAVKMMLPEKFRIPVKGVMLFFGQTF